MPDPTRDYLSLLLDRYWFAPPVALWRAIELRVLARETFARPILDLGCGDGLVAEVLFQNAAPVEFGFDPWLEQVRKAPATQAYGRVQQAYGDAMPYKAATFGTVFSNSVLEHIPDLDPVLLEAARVLRPGGHMLLTVPSDAFRRLLAGHRSRTAAGDHDGAEAYAKQIDTWLDHYRYPTPEAWRQALAQVGIRLERAVYYVSSAAADLWDRANGTYGVRAGANPLYRWLASPRLRSLGYQSLLRRWIVRTLSHRWRSLYAMDVPPDDVGAGLLVVGVREG